jgi:hypothetical protein
VQLHYPKHKTITDDFERSLFGCIPKNHCNFKKRVNIYKLENKRKIKRIITRAFYLKLYSQKIAYETKVNYEKSKKYSIHIQIIVN